MKYLIPLLILISPQAWATTPAPIEPETILAMLQDALKVAGQLPGVLGAILIGFISLAIGLLLIAAVMNSREKRERAAYEYDLTIRKIQAENLERIQRDASQALMQNMDSKYKEDYKIFTAAIAEKKYERVCVKCDSRFHETIANFLYDEKLSAEDRAARVILVIRPQRNLTEFGEAVR
jgi:hypothetical protein